MAVPALLLACALIGEPHGVQTAISKPAAPWAPQPVSSDVSRADSPKRPLPGIGAKLAARMRSAKPDEQIRFLISGVEPDRVRSLGGNVLAVVGGIISASGTKKTISSLAPIVHFMDAPKSHRPALDVSRRLIGADRTDFGLGFADRYDGTGVLIAMYDTGIDIFHPDFSVVAGASRVFALWDQTSQMACSKDELDRCWREDEVGHGTSVASIAAGSAPVYRGIAPGAELVVAQSEDFEDLVGALAFFSDVARSAKRPMVVNLSLAGHEGPHDGTSLEAQAVEMLPFIAVTAAGNDGTNPVHARIDLAESDATIPLAPPSRGASTVAYVEVWGEPSSSLTVGVALFDDRLAAIDTTSLVGAGDPGVTEPLQLDQQEIASVRVDFEPVPNPDNGKAHARIELELDLERLRDRGAHVALTLAGTGRADLWTDAPYPYEVSTFRPNADLGLPNEISGDSDLSISDLATAPSAIAVSSFVTKSDALTASSDMPISSFSSYGPSTDEERTGPKPNLAAPGEVIVASKSRAALSRNTVDSLYAAGRGTSLACAHVSGALAVLLQIDPTLSKTQLEDLLITHAVSGDPDPRAGAGHLDLARAAGAIAPSSSGCRATGAVPATWTAAAYLVLIALLGARAPKGGRRARSR